MQRVQPLLQERQQGQERLQGQERQQGQEPLRGPQRAGQTRNMQQRLTRQ